MIHKFITFQLLWILLSIQVLKAQQWTSVTTGTNGTGVRTMFGYNGNLYIGGTFDTAGSVPCNNIALWNGNTFSPLDLGVYGLAGAEVICFANYNGDLIVGGSFDSAGSIQAKHLAMWNGTNWSAFTQNIISSVNSLAYYNGELWSDGSVDTSNGSGFYVSPVQWNGAQWACKGQTMGTVSAMLNFNGDLYLAGAFTQIVPPWLIVNYIVKWNGTNWAALGSGFNNTVYCLAEYNGELYAGGELGFSGAQSLNHIAKWDGNNWQPLGAGVTGPVNSMVTYNGELYVAGSFDSAGTVAASNIAKWNGINWAAVDSGFNSYALSLAVHNNELYAGGWFTSSGNTPVSHIAKLDTSSITTTNSLSLINSISIFPNPISSVLNFQFQKQNIKKATITIYDILTQIVFHKELSNPSNNYAIDFSAFTNGIYLFEANIDGERIVRKIVKE